MADSEMVANFQRPTTSATNDQHPDDNEGVQWSTAHTDNAEWSDVDQQAMMGNESDDLGSEAEGDEDEVHEDANIDENEAEPSMITPATAKRARRFSN